MWVPALATRDPCTGQSKTCRGAAASPITPAEDLGLFAGLWCVVFVFFCCFFFYCVLLPQGQKGI